MLNLYGENINSRLLLGSAKYPSLQILKDAIKISKTKIVTVSLRRMSPNLNIDNSFWKEIQNLNLKILPNTSGCFLAKDAVMTAHMAREVFSTNWIKLEIFGDSFTLQPNPFELLKAAAELIKNDFCVFPYMTDDLILAKELVNLGCKVLMPWGAPIGSGKGILYKKNLQLLRERFPEIKIIIDAGIGAPSHAALAMELGMDAVLLNTAVAEAIDPIKMAKAFANAIEAGRDAFCSGLITQNDFARASTPLIGIPFQ